MKVVYDLSIFGTAEKFRNARAGIYRVVDELAKALMDTKRCSLSFSAFNGDFYDYALKHLLASPEYTDVYLPHFPYHRLNHQFSAWRSHATKGAAAATGIKKLGWKSMRKLTRHAAEFFKPESANETNLQKADIFHSPFHSIPKRVRRHQYVQLFMTVYDLIPILQPQFFEKAATQSDHELKAIVDGIGREDWVVCISQSTKDDLCNYRQDLDPRRIFITPLGASKYFYPSNDQLMIEAARSKYKIPAGRYVLSVCTLEPRKNLAHLVRCFAQLIQQENLPDLHLVLVGHLGWKYESIFAELTALAGLRDRIIITGYVADNDLAALYGGSLFFVYPSFYEGFGLPPLEAMQCGVPVIASNTSSLPEVVGEAGITVDPKDADALCQAMSQLVVSRELRETMSQKSLKQAGQFSWTRCANQTLNAYQTACDSIKK